MRVSSTWFSLLAVSLLVTVSVDAGNDWFKSMFKPKNRIETIRGTPTQQPETKVEPVVTKAVTRSGPGRAVDAEAPRTTRGLTSDSPKDIDKKENQAVGTLSHASNHHLEHEQSIHSRISKLLSGDEMRSEFDEINNMLVDAEESDEPVKNLMIALDWLKVAAKNKDYRRSQALSQFTSLLKLLVPTNIHCDLVGYHILHKNVEASGVDLMLPDDAVGPLRRIDIVVRDIAYEHASQCKYEYPKSFKWTREGTTKDRVYRDIQQMLDKVIQTSKRHVFTLDDRKDPRTVLKEKAVGISDMRGEAQAEAVFKYINSRAIDDPDIRYLATVGDQKRRGKWVIMEQKVRDMFQKYVFSQCEYLVRATGHIMLPALFEERIWPAALKYKALDEDFTEFMIWLQYYRLCDRLVNHDREVFMKNIIKLIHDKY